MRLLFMIIYAVVLSGHSTSKVEIDMSQKINTYRYSYIDVNGNSIIDAAQYDGVQGFSEGLAAVYLKNKGWGFIDKTGYEVIPPHFKDVRRFSEGLAIVKEDKKFGFINKSGEIVVKPEYDAAYNFSEGIAVVEKQNKSFFIDKAGNILLSQSLDEIEFNIDDEARFSEGLLAAHDCASSKRGFVDKTGKFVIEPRFKTVGIFSEGLARVAVYDEDKGERIGFINHNGNFVIPLKFNTDDDFRRNSADFSEGLASLSEGLNPSITDPERFFYIDKNGHIALKTNFFYVGSFHEGRALVYAAATGKWGYIDKTGNLIIPLIYDRVSDYSDGLAYSGFQLNE